MIIISPIYTPNQFWKYISHQIRYGKRHGTTIKCGIAILNTCKFLDNRYNIDYDYLIHYFVKPCIKIYNGKW